MNLFNAFKSAQREIGATERKQWAAFGAEVRKAREAKGWSQSDLSRRLPCGVDHLRAIEAGEASPSAHLAWRLSDVLRGDDGGRFPDIDHNKLSRHAGPECGCVRSNILNAPD